MTIKLCPKCNTIKSTSEFGTMKRAADGLQYKCKECARQAGRDNYHANKERYFKQAKQRDSEMRTKLRALKSVPCADCNQYFDWVCMDFDHLPQFEKSYEISYMMRHRMAWDKILEEVAKCEVVCSNCHRLRSKSRWTIEEDFDGDF